MIRFTIDLRNDRLNAIRDRIDSGGAAGKLCIYGGERPYPGGPVTAKLCEIPFAYPSASDAEDGLLIFDTSDGANACASGKATWARVTNSRGAFVFDGSVGVKDGDFRLKTVDLWEGMKVSVNGSISEGNG